MPEQLITCTVCPNGCLVKIITDNHDNIESVTGFKCKRGDAYARAEITAPVRTLTALVQAVDGEIAMCPVRSSRPVPKNLLCEIAKLAESIKIQAPIHEGDLIVKNIFGTQADLIATRTIEKIR